VPAARPERESRLMPALLTTLLFAALLPLLARQLPQLEESTAWLALLACSLPLAIGHWQYRRQRRRFWLRHHMNRESRWYAWLQGGYLSLPWSAARAVVLAAALWAGLSAGALSLWLMVLAPLLTACSCHVIAVLFGSALNRQALGLFSEQQARWLTVSALMLLYVVIALFLPRADWTGIGFGEAASRALYGATYRSELVSAIRAADRLPAFLYEWSIQNVLSGTDRYWLILTGWLAMLARGALVFLPAVELSLAARRWLMRPEPWTSA